MPLSPKRCPPVNAPMSFAFEVGDLPWKRRRSYRIELGGSTRRMLTCSDKHCYVYGVDALWFHRTQQINRRHTPFWLHTDDVHVKQETQENGRMESTNQPARPASSSSGSGAIRRPREAQTRKPNRIDSGMGF